MMEMVEKSLLDEEILRHNQEEQYLERKLIGEKNGLIHQITKKISFELSEMEEVLKNLQDKESKMFLESFIGNIKKTLEKAGK